MSINETGMAQEKDPIKSYLPQGDDFKKIIRKRHFQGRIWRTIYITSIVIAIIALLSLIYNIVDQSFGLVAVNNNVDPASLSDKPIEELDGDQIGDIVINYVDATTGSQLDKNFLRTQMASIVLGLNNEGFREIARDTVKNTLAGKKYPEELADSQIAALDRESYVAIMVANLSDEEMREFLTDTIIKPQVVGTWKLHEMLLDRDEIEANTTEKFPDAIFEFRPWINRKFLGGTHNSIPELSGIRTAALGSFYMILVTIGIAFPLGVGAAIYLEEYATDNWLNRIIKININNLAGVPSIVYGMLGLVIFVRSLHSLTNGSTLISAGATMALLILPVIIINAQEAIRAVPSSLRQASYGLGSTKWQTVWYHVLPNAIPGIMTGTILAMSRAIGETAPLIVIGAATRITKDPSFQSKFTVLPIQIYHWTSDPQPEFRNVAAAAILVLMLLLLTLNSVAIVLRNRFSRRI